MKSAQQILDQLEQNWVAALKRNDVTFVDSVLAEEFVATYGDGSRGDRKHELKLVADFNHRSTSGRSASSRSRSTTTPRWCGSRSA